MTEEVKVEATAEVVVEEKQEAAPQLSAIEQQALDMGWRPREEFNGTDDEFIDAKEFVRRKPLFDRLDQQGKQLKRVMLALDQLKSHHSKVRENEYNRALAELKAARKQAITDSDGDRFDVLDDRIKEIEREALDVLEEASEPVNRPDPAEFQNWVSKNSWYQKEEAMTAYADKIGIKFKADVDRGDMTPLQVLQKVEQAVRAEFPHKFRNPNKDQAPAVGEGKQPSSKGSTSFQLDETERKMMENFVRTGTMTKEEYIKELKALKGVK